MGIWKLFLEKNKKLILFLGFVMLVLLSVLSVGAQSENIPFSKHATHLSGISNPSKFRMVNPDVTITNDNKFAVVYQKNTRYSNDRNIFYTVVKNGDDLMLDEPVTDLNGRTRNPEILLTSNRNLIIAWEDGFPETAKLKGKVYDENFNSLDGAVQYLPAGTAENNPALIEGYEGDVLLLYEEKSLTEKEHSHIKLQVLNSKFVGKENFKVSDNVFFQYTGDAALDKSRNYQIVWANDIALNNPSRGIMHRTYSDTFKVLSDEKFLIRNEKDHYNPLLLFANNAFVLFYIEAEGPSRELKYQKFDSNFEPVGDAKVLAGTTKNLDYSVKQSNGDIFLIYAYRSDSNNVDKVRVDLFNHDMNFERRIHEYDSRKTLKDTAIDVKKDSNLIVSFIEGESLVVKEFFRTGVTRTVDVLPEEPEIVPTGDKGVIVKKESEEVEEKVEVEVRRPEKVEKILSEEEAKSEIFIYKVIRFFKFLFTT